MTCANSRTIRKCIFLPIALILITSGCATLSSGRTVTVFDDVRLLSTSEEGLSPDAVRLLRRAKKYAKWRSQALLVGGLAGCVTGYLLGDGNNRKTTAAAGCLVGAEIGYLGGAYLAKLNKESVKRRNSLEGQLAAARGALEETRDAVAVSRQMVRAETNKIDELNEDYRAGRIQKAEYEARIETLESKLRIVTAAVDNGERSVNAMQRQVDAYNKQNRNAAKLERQLARMKKEVKRLRGIRVKLVSAIATIPPGVDKPDVEVA